jgi:hypothetical protein
MKYWVNGCIGKKCQERRWLTIIDVKGTTFCFLISLLVFVFLLFVGYGIWCVVLHGMLAPRLEVGGGTLLPRFSLLV